MSTFADLAVANPSIRQQYDEWRQERATQGQDAVDWGGFRQYLLARGQPDPGPRPPEDFVGEDFKAAHPEWTQRWYGTPASGAPGLGGGAQRQEYQDFVNRYEQGPPYHGISDQEALQRYGQVAPQLSPEAYHQSAQEAFARLSPQERQEFARYLQQQAQQQNVSLPDLGGGGYERYQDPGTLAQMTTQVHQQQPDLLGRLLGGQSGTMLDNPLAKAALAGVAAMAAKRMLGGR